MQELREQLERVVRNRRYGLYSNLQWSNEYERIVQHIRHGSSSIADQEERIAILTAAIRAAVVTREAP